MWLSIIKDAFELATITQSLLRFKIGEMIDQTRQEIEIVLEKLPITQPGVDCKAVLNELKDNILRIAQIIQIKDTEKELNLKLKNYGKILEMYSDPNISKACKNVDFDTHTLNQIIVNHFYHQGLFDVGDHFVSVLGEPEYSAIMKSPFLELYQILEAMTNRNLEPALNWVATNSAKLAQNGSDIMFKLRAAQFVRIVQNERGIDALEYAQTYLTPLTSTHPADVRKLTVCFLWAGNLDKSPFAELLSPSYWEKLAKELKHQFCNLLGQAYSSPLYVTLVAGVRVLPYIIKFKNLMEEKKQEWESLNLLPVPVELNKEFQFHSVVVCPLSKDQATKDNPPMLMSCGHVLCKQTILVISKDGTQVFRCPYCPGVINPALCMHLHL